MIKVSVFYPNEPGAEFDHAYYAEKHMPMVAAKMGDACLRYTVDKGIAGGEPGSPPTYVGMCHIFCNSVESFQAGFGPHAGEIMADIPNYTDLSPSSRLATWSSRELALRTLGKTTLVYGKFGFKVHATLNYRTRLTCNA